MIALKQGDRDVAQLLVRKIPDDVMEGIRKAAAAEGLSVEEFARRVLQQQAYERNRWREFLNWATSFQAAQVNVGQRFPDSTQMIREDRDRR